MVDGACEILSTLLCRGSIRESQLSVNGHEEPWSVVEELEPHQWTLLSDIMSHCTHEYTRTFVNSGRASRGKRL
jgi:hypothetical protein